MFGCGIAEHGSAAVTATAGQALRRADQDDGTAPTLTNDRRHGCDQCVPHALEVGVDDCVEHRLGMGLGVADRDHTGVGDDDVDIAEIADGRAYPCFELGKVAKSAMTGTDVAAGGAHLPDRLVEQVGLGAQRIRDAASMLGAEIDGDDVRTLFGQRDGMAAALTPRGPGDDGDGAVQFAHCYPEAGTDSTVPVLHFSAKPPRWAAAA